MNYHSVIDFWFNKIDSSLWWKKDSAFDLTLEKKFAAYHKAASAAELAQWREDPLGRLAEVIVLDQFSRNLFRDSAKAFAQDTMALVLSQEAIRNGDDLKLTAKERLFLYMPFMHSESKMIHEQAVELFTALEMPDNLNYELRHKAIIDRFGRYPHRNKVLGRNSTEAEVEFLKQPGSSF